MPGSTTSVLGEPDDYQAVLRMDGEVDLLVIGRGVFRAGLIRVALPRMCLVAGAEQLARIAFIRVPTRLVHIAQPVRSGAALFRNGTPPEPTRSSHTVLATAHISEPKDHATGGPSGLRRRTS